MARINLVTIHWGKCFGAVMQTYATCKILKSMGHKVCVINVVPELSIERFKRLSFYVKLYAVTDIRYLLFKRFHFPNLTRLMFLPNEKKIPAADYTVVGSDQVWNIDITKSLSKYYFLDYVRSGERLSLASSFGKDSFDDVDGTFKELLQKFKAISVREDTGVKICKDCFGLEATQLIDPTLAYNDYSKLVRKRHTRPYICKYLLQENNEQTMIANFISDYMGMSIKTKKNILCKQLFNGPLNMLSDIYNASFVVVSSFHGLAFCLQFEKRFIVLCANEEKFTRLHSLLHLVGLEDRYIKSMEDLQNRKQILTEAIDYVKVKNILEKESRKYRDFIRANIS